MPSIKSSKARLFAIPMGLNLRVCRRVIGFRRVHDSCPSYRPISVTVLFARHFGGLDHRLSRRALVDTLSSQTEGIIKPEERDHNTGRAILDLSKCSFLNVSWPVMEQGLWSLAQICCHSLTTGNRKSIMIELGHAPADPGA